MEGEKSRRHSRVRSQCSLSCMSERKNDVPDEKQIPRVTVGLPPSRGALLTGKSPIGLSYAGRKRKYQR